MIKVQKAMANEYVKAECDNFALKQETFDAQPYSAQWEGRGFRHEIRVMNVRKAKASEYVKAECENFIFNPISTGGGVFSTPGPVNGSELTFTR